jgi:nicotinamide-nucleotide amidase
MFSPALIGRAAAVLGGYRERAWRIATAESCTGGLVAGLLTEIPGSSDVIERGFVTYSNEAKVGLLGVPGELLRSNAHVAVSITGVAGPGGGSARKPVGLVHFGIAAEGRPAGHLERRYGDLGRSAIRLAAVEDALELLESALR